MRPLKSHFRDDALTTLETVLKKTKEACVFRRAQAVRAVVAGYHINAVSATFHLTNSALRKWVQRFATQGPQGLLDRPGPVDRAKRPVHSNGTSTVLLIKTPSSMAPTSFPLELSRTGHRLGPAHGRPAGA